MKLGTLLFLSQLFFVSYSIAQGQIIFDLKDQYFAGTLISPHKHGYNMEYRYDTGETLVTTDTVFNSHYYENGFFTLKIKKPINNWNINIKKYFGTQNRKQFSNIRLTSVSGENYFITFNDDYKSVDRNLAVDGTKIYGDVASKTIQLTIQKRGDRITYKIYGKVLLEKQIVGFGQLRKIEIELVNNHDKLITFDVSHLD